MNPIVDTVQGFMQGVVKPLLDKFIPDAEQRLQAEQFAAQNLQALTIGQQEINKVEAASPSMFVAGWRPFIGWVCGAAMAYASIVHYILQWILDVVSILTGQSFPPLPHPDVGITMEILFGMLGMAGWRTYEKLNGVAAVTHK